ncbi:MAG: CsbD family protein [Actinobacteria bacterium]|nr:MAG: CsbD family protein [Actinomycetota bacterium]
MGAFEEAKGKVKKVVGDVTEDPQLRQEGEAQEERGEAESEATQERAKAKAHDAKAKEKEMEQRAARSSKDH